MANSFSLTPQASPVIIQLLKGVLYNDTQPALWQDLLTFQATIRDYLAVIGLQVVIDETEGYAFLRQRPEIESDATEASLLPRLIQRRPLSYPVSLLCVLLRKRLIEQDANGGETRVILNREQIIDMLRVFLPESGNEAKIIEQIDQYISKMQEYGFLRRLKADEDLYEVRRIIKALVDASWLSDIDEKLRAYQAHANSIS